MRKFEEMLEMAGLSEGDGRKVFTERKEGNEVEFAGMGFPSLPQVSCPIRDVRFAKIDGGITGFFDGTVPDWAVCFFVEKLCFFSAARLRGDEDGER